MTDAMTFQPQRDERLLTAAEVAERLGVKLRVVQEHSLGKRPKIPCIRLNRHTVRYSWPTVLKALSKGAITLSLFWTLESATSAGLGVATPKLGGKPSYTAAQHESAKGDSAGSTSHQHSARINPAFGVAVIIYGALVIGTLWHVVNLTRK